MSQTKISDAQNEQITSGIPRLFEYFAVVTLEETSVTSPDAGSANPNGYIHCCLSIVYQRKKKKGRDCIPQDAKRQNKNKQTKKEVRYRPVVKYAYNANKTSMQSTTMTRASPSLSVDRSQREKKDNKASPRLTQEQMEEESEILDQIRKFCFPDLSDILHKYKVLLSKYQKEDRYYRALFQHPLQSEKFDFVLTKTGAQRLYGHCRRLYNTSVQCVKKKNNIYIITYRFQKLEKLANGKCAAMPTSLCLVSKHPFLSLLDQIMDHILTRWLCCSGAIFPLLDCIIRHPTPALGDVFRVPIKSQIPNVPDEE
ncbi:hypothetical protein RFI_27826, partial [Reticulomyxa filosa]